jgi:hypothetical protein
VTSQVIASSPKIRTIVFEEFLDGSAIWRGCAFGTGNVETKLLELARESRNKFFALSLQDRPLAVIRPLKSSGRRNYRGVS